VTESRDQIESPILVTGASGFLGDHLVRRLIADGHELVGTYLTQPIVHAGLDARRVDLSNVDEVERFLRETRPRTIFHTAAQTNVGACQTHPAQARGALVDATRNLIDVLANLDSRAALVMVSSDQVYDGHPPCGKKRFDEDDPAHPLSTYGMLKREAEEIVLARRHGAVVRSALIYGPPATHKQSFLAWMLGTLGRGEPVTLFEDEWRTPIHVDDLIDGLIAVGGDRLDGLWLAGGSDELSRLMMGEVACEVFGYSRSLLQPSRLSDSLYAAPRPANVCLDSRKLEYLVGRRFRTFREGLQSIGVS